MFAHCQTSWTIVFHFKYLFFSFCVCLSSTTRRFKSNLFTTNVFLFFFFFFVWLAHQHSGRWFGRPLICKYILKWVKHAHKPFNPTLVSIISCIMVEQKNIWKKTGPHFHVDMTSSGWADEQASERADEQTHGIHSSRSKQMST